MGRSYGDRRQQASTLEHDTLNAATQIDNLMDLVIGNNKVLSIYLTRVRARSLDITTAGAL
jgi:hypothetical protein